MLKVGDKIKAWFGWEGKIIKIETDPDLKPYVCLMENGKTQYFHIDQVEKIA
jgi:hypothetical protein